MTDAFDDQQSPNNHRDVRHPALPGRRDDFLAGEKGSSMQDMVHGVIRAGMAMSLPVPSFRPCKARAGIQEQTRNGTGLRLSPE
jgi:hypothetical protein